ncbi:MAG TPA: ABC transporter ATP-binding protein [Gammaproteobacteria bacterium]|nr:ABC transporter ATP-binding protein [Gammaproteobacteria bacterium]HKV98155.1 ABC transporter ATP-binding protein [Gammaproteobacteria bacterium]
MNDAHTLQAAHADTVIDVRGLDKIYAGGFQALKNIDLTVRRGEIFALLGPNGAGKTTLISIICGIVNPGRGSITVEGHDVVREWRATRSIVGLVPQELKTDAFESVWNTVRFSRGLFNKAPDDAYIEQLLKDLTLWEKRSNKVMMLSGGMKRRVMIAKALSHQPRVLFLDEPSAGVDVELRRDMWAMVRRLRKSGVTIILTTHYIEEAEDMADRVGVINKGELVVVEETATLMQKLGKKQLRLQLHEPLASLPATLSAYNLALNGKGDELIYTYDTQSERTGITPLLRDLAAAGIGFKDLNTQQDTLEKIFLDLVKEHA